MNTYVALLRGINVGGKTTLSMNSLVDLFTDIGFTQVDTYIRSGNIVFSSEKGSVTKIRDLITESISTGFSFSPKVLVLQPDEIREALALNPFPESEPKAVQVGFLWENAMTPNLTRMEELKKDTEEIHLSGKLFFLYAPDGIGRSMLASNAEKLLGVTKTDRNLRTVRVIEDMLDRRQ